MSNYDSDIARRLAKKISEQIETEIRHIISGVLTLDQYRDKTGFLRGLNHALELLGKIESDINQGK